MPATTSTADLYGNLRATVLAFTDGVTSIASLIGTKLYNDAPPQAAVFPYVVLRIMNSITSEFGSGDRLDFDIEVMIFARPYSAAQTAHKVADLIEEAFLRYTVGTTADGGIYIHSRTRDSLPPGTGETDREVVQIRLVFSAFTWPLYLINRP